MAPLALVISPLLSSVPGRQSPLRLRCFATLTGAFGSELFHGPKVSDPGVKLLELPKEEHATPPKARLMFRKYPKEIMHTRASYVLHKRRQQGHFKRFFHMTMKDHEVCILGSTDSRQLRDNRINEELKARTRGFAIQLIIEGRGKRAYFDPAYPHLKCRFSAKLIDFTNPILRVADSVRVEVNKLGTLITVYGYDRRKVHKLAEQIQSKNPCNPYTMRGVHYGGFPLKKRTVSTKKK